MPFRFQCAPGGIPVCAGQERSGDSGIAEPTSDSGRSSAALPSHAEGRPEAQPACLHGAQAP